MLGGIIAMVVVYWFYRSAEQRGLPNFQWAFAGLISFYIPNIAWSLLVSKPWVQSLHAQHPTVATGLINLSSVMIGVGCAVLVRQMFLLKAKNPAR
jgi:lipoprotein signal peptidase